ncbi:MULTISPECIES: flavin reductase family protein [unclassified Pseudofrankia]|uniref:flavin reductase family protein n=1 Tax=unclassified Pseudofrankia TaxID=2994372 RepID=UPI0008D960D1|nr:MULTISPECIES: flavin reductase family protein [unclassified Pseudofrankia]MDT3446855.1 flavin reductase family protein [Pseudofrankia sp. BMG5.37]OHV63472.1 oxidoreductase [Pseudofrankia sp. BMG5.36]
MTGAWTEASEGGGPLDGTLLRLAFGCFPSGVTAVCAMADGRPTGMAMSSFTSVSLDPPLVSVCVAHTSTTWPVLAVLPRLGVSVLAQDHGPVATALSAKRGDRFAEVAWAASTTGAVFVHGSTLWLECEVDRQVAAGDHDIVVLRIHALQSHPEVAPMVFHASRYRQLGPAR